MKITRKQLRRIVEEACGLQTHGAAHANVTPEVPSPQDYEAVRSFMSSNPDMVDLGVNMVMGLSGASCERSTAQAIIDHLQDKLGGYSHSEMPEEDDMPQLSPMVTLLPIEEL